MEEYDKVRYFMDLTKDEVETIRRKNDPETLGEIFGYCIRRGDFRKKKPIRRNNHYR